MTKKIGGYMLAELFITGMMAIQSNNIMLNSTLLNINAMNLIKTDIYECTKPNYHKYVYYFNRYEYYKCYVNEHNKIADSFWINNNWELGYSLSIIFNSIALYGINKIDRSGLTGYAASLILNILEINAINAWSNYEFTYKNIYVYAPIYTALF